MESIKNFTETRGSYGLLMTGLSNILLCKAEAAEPGRSRSRSTKDPLTKWRTAALKSKVVGLVSSRSNQSQLSSRKNRGPIFNSVFPVTKADSCYVAASTIAKDGIAVAKLQGLPIKGLARFQFLEAVVKIALARFHDAGELQPLDAMQRLVEDLSLGSDLLYFRRTLHAALFCEECCLVIRHCRRLLNDAFNMYIKYKRVAGDLRNSHMSYGAWHDFMEACNAGFDDEEVHKLAFVLGKEICVNQHRNMEHMAMSWSEFLVGVAAAVRVGYRFEQANFADRLLNFIRDHVPEAIEVAIQAQQAAAVEAMEGAVSRHGTHPEMATEMEQLTFVITEVFKEADDDGSGSLTLREFTAACEKRHVIAIFQEMGLTLKDLRLLFRRMDADNSGSITPHEFIDGLLGLRKAMHGSRRIIDFLRKVFLLIDTQMDGRISKSQFFEYAKQPAHLERFKQLSMKMDDLDDLWAAAKQVNPGDRDVTEEALIAGLIDLSQERGNVIRGLNYLNQLFMVADVDGSSTLTKSEVKKFLCRQEVTRKLQTLRLFVPDWIGIFGAIDANGDGEITWQELRTAMERMWSETRPDDRDDAGSGNDEDESSGSEGIDETDFSLRSVKNAATCDF